MTTDVVRLDQLRRSDVAYVGGKAANLGELTQIDGVRVPPGFCVSTDAFRRSVLTASLTDLLDRLTVLHPSDRSAINERCGEIRSTVARSEMPVDLVESIRDAVRDAGDGAAWAVRSSSTAEDLPTASFAGQHDTYLNVVGAEAVIDAVRRCWASLYTERAVAYRLQQGIDQLGVSIAVVVQRMVAADASGVMFTADPLTFDRTVVAIEAVIGLGEALVSGLANPELHRVRAGQIIATDVTRGDAGRAALTDAQVVQLAALGRRIEAHFGGPQDIEWCLDGDGIHVVQSRPITTLFPIPEANDGEHHVYVSVGHGQMMTDAMKPLGLSVWQMTTPAPMSEAGSRLFVDVTMRLATPTGRAALLDVFGKGDPLLRDALETILERGDFIPSLPDDPTAAPPAGAPVEPLDADPAIVTELIEDGRRSVATSAREIRTLSGPALFEFILADFQELRRVLFDPRSHRAFMTAIDATWWLNEHVFEWLGEKNVADTITQSVPQNVTSAMGLSLLDVADVIRPHAAVVGFLRGVADEHFLDHLDGLDGGREVHAAIDAFLTTYGMRCGGEIDITRPRWSERPSALLPVLLGHVEHMEPGAASRRFEQGRVEAAAKELDVLERLRALPDGEEKAAQTKEAIDRVRTFIGYREYPKYGMVSRYFIYKQALLREADRLVAAGVLREREEIYFLRFDELHEAVRTQRVDLELIDRRVDAFRSHERLTPPRVLTSDGEAVNGSYRRGDIPVGALAGLAVSSGTVEGRARVVRDIAAATLEPGDILVTAYTDPSWTPLFVAIAGLVTEVGGTMTHGAVIAREYGLPAVVGVEGATERIRDGQRIRLDGTEGYVMVLPRDDPDAAT